MDTEFDVINYEIGMFLSALIFYQKRMEKDCSDSVMENYIKNALAESLVLHIRVLTEIFMPGGREDDIKAVNVMKKWCDEHKLLIKNLHHAYEKVYVSELKGTSKTLIDKLLAHGTNKRGDMFDWSPVIRTMEPPLIEILRTLSKEEFPALNLLSHIEDCETKETPVFSTHTPSSAVINRWVHPDDRETPTHK